MPNDTKEPWRAHTQEYVTRAQERRLDSVRGRRRRRKAKALAWILLVSAAFLGDLVWHLIKGWG